MRQAYAVFTALLVLLSASLYAAEAQEPEHFPELPGAEVRQVLLADLTLTALQHRQLEEVSRSLHGLMRSLQAEMQSVSLEERRAKVRALMLGHAGDIAKIVSDAQRPKFEQNHARWLVSVPR